MTKSLGIRGVAETPVTSNNDISLDEFYKTSWEVSVRPVFSSLDASEMVYTTLSHVQFNRVIHFLTLIIK